MRIDGTRLDLRTMADREGCKPLIGGRRHIGVGGSMVIVSDVDSPDRAGINIAVPDPWVTIHCITRGRDEYVSPIDRDGWLDVAALTPWREYWLELDSLGGVRVERADSDGTDYRWYWPIPSDSWRRIQCG